LFASIWQLPIEGEVVDKSQGLEPWERGNTDPVRMNDQILFVRLAETITWCNSLETVAQLRSHTLRPSVFHEGLDEVVCEVGLSRALLYQRQKSKNVDTMPNFNGGEMLVYFPDQNLSDGYAELVSKGFYDVENVPPYDTWVAFFDDGPKVADRSLRRYLLCFVPQRFIELAEAGIDGNPEQCIQWLGQTHTQFKERFYATPQKLLLSSVRRLFNGRSAQ
jgi:hypothetical protein